MKWNKFEGIHFWTRFHSGKRRRHLQTLLSGSTSSPNVLASSSVGDSTFVVSVISHDTWKFVSILIWSFFLNLISTSKGRRMLQHSSQQRKNGEAKRVSMLLKFKFRFHPILLYFINYGFCFRLFWKSSKKFWSQLG